MPKRLLLFKLKIFTHGLQTPAPLFGPSHEAVPAVPGSATSLEYVSPWCLRIHIPFECYIYFLGWLCPPGQSYLNDTEVREPKWELGDAKILRF